MCHSPLSKTTTTTTMAMATAASPYLMNLHSNLGPRQPPSSPSLCVSGGSLFSCGICSHNGTSTHAQTTLFWCGENPISGVFLLHCCKTDCFLFLLLRTWDTFEIGYVFLLPEHIRRTHPALNLALCRLVFFSLLHGHVATVGPLLASGLRWPRLTDMQILLLPSFLPSSLLSATAARNGRPHHLENMPCPRSLISRWRGKNSPTPPAKMLLRRRNRKRPPTFAEYICMETCSPGLK